MLGSQGGNMLKGNKLMLVVPIKHQQTHKNRWQQAKVGFGRPK
jgi:hypothetical protein